MNIGVEDSRRGYVLELSGLWRVSGSRIVPPCLVDC